MINWKMLGIANAIVVGIIGLGYLVVRLLSWIWDKNPAILLYLGAFLFFCFLVINIYSVLTDEDN
jgi:hypothetical protein